MAVEDSTERETLLLRGSLDLCVLALLRAEPLHAYGLVRRLNEHGFLQSSYGTVYPLVTRLRQQGLITRTPGPGAAGPARSVLSLTEAGTTALARWSTLWRHTVDRVENVLSPQPEQARSHDTRGDARAI